MCNVFAPKFRKLGKFGKTKKQKPYNIKVSAFKEKLGKLISAGTNIFTYQGKPVRQDDWEIIQAILERHDREEKKKNE
ncbi:hypothetical protein FEI15_01880 [Lacticaseibacillus zeae]|uniref:Uncharacterized protein n=1 Tax=Lacticaseibacillus zeae TaxID=57037 RepID=A0A5R8LUS9_LACZE|nr:hypothetical protein FEI15_01880 [Lacticaseibacillus zeae]